eukprot:15445391-Alexandrium_andersonii.AAC.1
MEKVERGTAASFTGRVRSFPGKGDARGPEAQATLHRCDACDRAFRSAKALAMHNVRTHAHTNGVAQRVSTPWCPACVKH